MTREFSLFAYTNLIIDRSYSNDAANATIFQMPTASIRNQRSWFSRPKFSPIFSLNVALRKLVLITLYLVFCFCAFFPKSIAHKAATPQIRELSNSKTDSQNKSNDFISILCVWLRCTVMKMRNVNVQYQICYCIKLVELFILQLKRVCGKRFNDLSLCLPFSISSDCWVLLFLNPFQLVLLEPYLNCKAKKKKENPSRAILS